MLAWKAICPPESAGLVPAIMPYRVSCTAPPADSVKRKPVLAWNATWPFEVAGLVPRIMPYPVSRIVPPGSRV
ncbi:hypothetical protein [Actinoplanes nipponensis]|uniref:hypothetical protein n=1 Tax=Actinoplanes nipponensis TaxID=135950 RepID=UPI0031F03CA7